MLFRDPRGRKDVPECVSSAVAPNAAVSGLLIEPPHSVSGVPDIQTSPTDARRATIRDPT
jgi:hypothetical protein